VVARVIDVRFHDDDSVGGHRVPWWIGSDGYNSVDQARNPFLDAAWIHTTIQDVDPVCAGILDAVQVHMAILDHNPVARTPPQSSRVRLDPVATVPGGGGTL
jgi:hypothetical protein